MVSKTKAQENLEQLQGSLCSILQGDPKITKDLEDQRLCSERARHTSRCGTFCQDAAGPHPGASKSHNSYTSQQNLGRAADEDNIRAIKPIRYPRSETHDSATRERPAEKNGTSFGSVRARPSGVQQFDPIRSELEPRPQCLFKERKKIRP